MGNEIIDGIIRDDAWNAASVKVLHLLKQPSKAIEHSSEQRSMTIREVGERELHKKELTGFWREIAMRSLAVHHPEIAWRNADNDAMNHALAASAVVNIEKTPGKETSEQDLRNWAKVNREWRDQVEEYHPHVVLCGGLITFWAAYDAFGLQRQWAYLPTGIRQFIHNRAIWLALPHPAARTMDGMVYTWVAASRVSAELRTSRDD